MVDRAMLPAGADPERVLESVIAPIYFRYLLGGRPLDEDFVTGLVDLVADAAQRDELARAERRPLL